MVNVKGYISSNFAKAFFTIFLPFFLIISLIYLVKISSLTSQIQITFKELLMLYSYSIPSIVFYTLPFSFISALTNVLLKLSQANELIALYALGLKAKKVLRPLLVLAVLFSFLLLSLSFLAMPLGKQLIKEFKSSKKADAKINIVAGKLGQKFGDYYIYVKENNKDNLKNIVIYNRTKDNEEQFFSSQEGKIKNIKGITSLELTDGYGYTYSEDKLQQAKYQRFEVFDRQKKKVYQFDDIIAFWSQASHNIKRLHRLFFFLFVSFIPLLSLYIVASFSMINPRYQENRSFIIISLTGLGLYLVASSMEKWGNFVLLPLTMVMIVGLGQWLFHKRVSKYF